MCCSPSARRNCKLSRNTRRSGSGCRVMTRHEEVALRSPYKPCAARSVDTADALIERQAKPHHISPKLVCPFQIIRQIKAHGLVDAGARLGVRCGRRRGRDCAHLMCDLCVWISACQTHHCQKNENGKTIYRRARARFGCRDGPFVSVAPRLCCIIGSLTSIAQV